MHPALFKQRSLPVACPGAAQLGACADRARRNLNLLGMCTLPLHASGSPCSSTALQFPALLAPLLTRFLPTQASTRISTRCQVLGASLPQQNITKTQCKRSNSSSEGVAPSLVDLIASANRMAMHKVGTFP